MILARRAAAPIFTITIDIANTEMSAFGLLLSPFRVDFEEKCKKVG
jgi:hypothetical protein